MMRKWWFAVLVGLAPVAHVHAQDASSFRSSDAGAVFYELVGARGAYVRSVALDWVKTDESTEPVSLLLSHLSRAWVGSTGAGAESEICGIVIGMGGNPKVDGGGGLGVLVDPFVPGANVSPAAGLAGVVGSDIPTLAIIDEFNMTELAAALRDAETDGPRDLDEVVRTGAVLSSGFTSLLAAGGTASAVDVVHGHLVLHHVLSILNAKDGVVEAVVEGAEVGAPTTLSLIVANQAVVVHLYDIEFATLAGLQTALDDIVAIQEGFADPRPPLAVVMSWGLTGCHLETAYKSADHGGPPVAIDGAAIQTVVEFLYDSIVRLEDAEAIVSEVCSGLEDFRSSESGRHADAIACKTPEDRDMVATVVALARFEHLAATRIAWWADGVPLNTAFFASSGNESLPFPMPPASFQPIVAVAACAPTSAAESSRGWFSNVGSLNLAEEAVALGAWFPAPAMDGLKEGVGYWGTSFAAPLAALASWNRPGATAPYVPGTQLLWPTYQDLCVPYASW